MSEISSLAEQLTGSQERLVRLEASIIGINAPVTTIIITVIILPNVRPN